MELTLILSYLIAGVIALTFAKPMGRLIGLFLPVSNSPLVKGISFLIILVIASQILMKIGRWLNHFALLPLIHLVNSLLGAITGGIIGWIIGIVLLNLCFLIPSGWLSQQYRYSRPAQVMVKQTPGWDHQLIKKWLK